MRLRFNEAERLYIERQPPPSNREECQSHFTATHFDEGEGEREDQETQENLPQKRCDKQATRNAGHKPTHPNSPPNSTSPTPTVHPTRSWPRQSGSLSPCKREPSTSQPHDRKTRKTHTKVLSLKFKMHATRPWEGLDTALESLQ
jgi:hypothetical protein